ncbi:uncharacterized protein LOC110841558 [Zootermopsis nevadensis]|uniref:Uncharacterized protein n=1 Tax=Zootermopsis nevadensis TaxID=136037 RepID=A0A067RQD5_ZOONE|nr:uncharacterized protein LOC110841558 [Zootermopsis nevadensis]KDR22835.1 hypothetical protein L798_13087 [Zootermopsis nevadensis]
MCESMRIFTEETYPRSWSLNPQERRKYILQEIEGSHPLTISYQGLAKMLLITARMQRVHEDMCSGAYDARRRRDQRDTEALVKALEAEEDGPRSGTENELSVIGGYIDKIMKSDMPLAEEETLLSSQFENLKARCKKSMAVIEDKGAEVTGIGEHVNKLIHENERMQLQIELESDRENDLMEFKQETDESKEQLEWELEAMKKGYVDVYGTACDCMEGSQCFFLDSADNGMNEREVLMNVIEQQAAHKRLHSSTSIQNNLCAEGNIPRVRSQDYSGVNAEHERLDEKGKIPSCTKTLAIAKDTGGTTQLEVVLDDLKERQLVLEERRIQMQNELDSFSDMQKHLVVLKQISDETYNMSQQLGQKVDSLGKAGVDEIDSYYVKGSWYSEECELIKNIMERVEDRARHRRDDLLLNVKNQQAALYESSSIQMNLAAQRDVPQVRLRDRAGVDAELEKLHYSENKAKAIRIECDKLTDILGKVYSVAVPLLNKVNKEDIITDVDNDKQVEVSRYGLELWD